jgi:hypothetical protein
MAKATAIFANIQALLLGIDPSERKASDIEIRQQLSRTTKALQQFDGLFAILQIPNGKVTEGDVEAACVHARKGLHWWRLLDISVTVKAHLLESHSIDQMEFWKGVGNFMEDFIEQAHQWGDHDKRRSSGMRDRGKVAIAHSKWEALKLNPVVVKATIETAASTKRKFKHLDGSGRTPKQQQDATAKLQQTSEREEIRIDEEGDGADLSNTQLTVEENQKLDYKFRFAES